MWRGVMWSSLNRIGNRRKNKTIIHYIREERLQTLIRKEERGEWRGGSGGSGGWGVIVYWGVKYGSYCKWCCYRQKKKRKTIKSWRMVKCERLGDSEARRQGEFLLEWQSSDCPVKRTQPKLCESVVSESEASHRDSHRTKGGSKDT